MNLSNSFFFLFVCTFKTFYTLLIPDDADWIASEIVYIYFNKLY